RCRKHPKEFSPNLGTQKKFVQKWKFALLQPTGAKDDLNFLKKVTNGSYYILYFVNTVYHVLCVCCSHLRGTLQFCYESMYFLLASVVGVLYIYSGEILSIC
uniref:Uncharacterized protein n=1 Tax=Sciurus vulgaris TaxID=55149 RepID=A0A8D2AXB4_SCIVU